MSLRWRTNLLRVGYSGRQPGCQRDATGPGVLSHAIPLTNRGLGPPFGSIPDIRDGRGAGLCTASYRRYATCV